MPTVTMTDTAVAAIRQLTFRHAEEPGTGFRIATEDDVDGLSISLTAGPHSGDQIVDGVGVPVYLDPVAVAVLDGRALDATVNADGLIAFSVTDLNSR